jgi:signal transduction histidine kinase
MRWLAHDQPDLEEPRAAAVRVVKDATRAAEIISRIRLLFNKGIPERELVKVNEVIGEMFVLLRSEAIRYHKSVRTDLAADLPQVSDLGVGLPPQQADQIFNAFFTTKSRGTGLGLAISRSIVESHGGRLWALASSPRGANFHFTLSAGTQVPQ